MWAIGHRVFRLDKTIKVWMRKENGKKENEKKNDKLFFLSLSLFNN